MRKQKLFMLFTLSLLFSVLSVTAQIFSQPGDGKFARFLDKIPDKYVVILKDSAVGGLNNRRILTEFAGALTARYGGEITHVYGAAINGFAVEMDEKQAILLSQDELVETVYEDARAYPTQSPQVGAPWGIDRIDQRSLPLDTLYNYTSTGNGVNVYVIDSGINYTHIEFGGRAVPGEDYITPGTGGKDCHGHGTHIAGIIGGESYGVAKNAKLYSLRVFDCNGYGASLSIILAAIDWVTINHAKPAVVSMSLIFLEVIKAVNRAINNSTIQGITYVVSAGNFNDDACKYSPGRTPAAITVGASTKTDAKADFSNIGKCVDIFAPGEIITSAGISSNVVKLRASGTSMASAHVAGVAALYLETNPAALPSEVATEISCSASSNKLMNIGVYSPNLLLFSPLIWEPTSIMPFRNQTRCGIII